MAAAGEETRPATSSTRTGSPNERSTVPIVARRAVRCHRCHRGRTHDRRPRSQPPRAALMFLSFCGNACVPHRLRSRGTPSGLFCFSPNLYGKVARPGLAIRPVSEQNTCSSSPLYENRVVVYWAHMHAHIYLITVYTSVPGIRTNTRACLILSTGRNNTCAI